MPPTVAHEPPHGPESDLPEPVEVSSTSGFELYTSDLGFVVIKQDTLDGEVRIILTPQEASILRQRIGVFIHAARQRFNPENKGD